jgi:predicted nucleic acid-binding Zn ribbon protein
LLLEEGRWSMKARGLSRTKSIGDAIEELVAQLGIKKKLHEQDVFVVWDEAVGTRIAGVAHPARMLRGTLIVSVKSGAWRNELSMRKQEIVQKLNKLLGAEIVKDIKFQ